MIPPMKKLVPVVLLVIAAVALGPTAWQRFELWRQADDARKRVEWMLRALAEKDEQLALCQWARGKVVMPMADIEASLPDWKRFLAELDLGEVRAGWEVRSKRVLDELTVEVVIGKGDEERILLVQPNEPILVSFQD